jgi:hypothetical protein
MGKALGSRGLPPPSLGGKDRAIRTSINQRLVTCDVSSGSFNPVSPS